jgi:gas vesicle protein
MKFMKGMLIGGIVTAGIAMMYAETMDQSKRRMMKKGKQFAKKMGIV